MTKTTYKANGVIYFYEHKDIQKLLPHLKHCFGSQLSSLRRSKFCGVPVKNCSVNIDDSPDIQSWGLSEEATASLIGWGPFIIPTPMQMPML